MRSGGSLDRREQLLRAWKTSRQEHFSRTTRRLWTVVHLEKLGAVRRAGCTALPCRRTPLEPVNVMSPSQANVHTVRRCVPAGSLETQGWRSGKLMHHRQRNNECAVHFSDLSHVSDRHSCAPQCASKMKLLPLCHSRRSWGSSIQRKRRPGGPLPCRFAVSSGLHWILGCLRGCGSANSTANLLSFAAGFWGLGQAPPLSCSVPRDETRFAELTTSADQRDVVGAFTRLARLSQSAKASRFHASGACKYGLNSVADEREQAQSLLSPSFPRKDKQAHPHSNSVYASAPAANSGSRGELRDFTALSRHQCRWQLAYPKLSLWVKWTGDEVVMPQPSQLFVSS